MSSDPLAHFRKLFEATGISPLDELFGTIPYLTHQTRKKLMTVARARCYPEPGTVLHSQTWIAVKTLISQNPMFHETLRAILDSYMLSGFFLSALLSAPYSNEEVETIRSESLWKEVSVMETEPRRPSIDWYNTLTLDVPLHPDLKPAPNTNRRVQIALLGWIRKCQNRVLYPSMGNKSVSCATRANLENSMNFQIHPDTDVTSTTIEHFYSRSGLQVNGPCEMKQKWYPTQASPRTYYAQGGSAYHSSKYLRDPFNWLCDAFHPTNRYSRVSPSGIPVDVNEEDVWIYDLTSFTSLFHEHFAFLSFLAAYTEEVQVTVFDSWMGPQTSFLGQMIRDYIEQNVSKPSYVTKLSPLSLFELHHSVAGFLGVFGNLATCTFPHGVCLSTVHDKPDDCWCAGDDAGTKEDQETEGRSTFSMCSLLGTISWDKVFSASQLGAVALKRPIDIQHGQLYHHPNVLWPVFAVMCEQDIRFLDPMQRSPVERICGALVSFFHSCTRVPLSPSDIEFAYSFLSRFYQRYKLPVSGWYPPLTGFVPWHYTIPRLERGVFGKDPLHVLVDSFFGTEYVTGLVEDIPWDKSLPVLNETFTCNSDEHLSYLVKLGYLSRELVQCIYPGSEGLSRAHMDVSSANNLRFVYEFQVVEPIPDALQPLSTLVV